MQFIPKYELRQSINLKNYNKFLLVPTEFDLEEMTKLEKAIYFFIVDNCHGPTKVRISQQAIANKLGCHEKSVTRLVSVLRKKRFIFGFFNGYNQTLTYVVSLQILDYTFREEMAHLIPALNLHIYKNVTLLKIRYTRNSSKHTKPSKLLRLPKEIIFHWSSYEFGDHKMLLNQLYTDNLSNKSPTCALPF
jgi:DNA-binding Lrp family transcriptional regulator